MTQVYECSHSIEAGRPKIDVRDAGNVRNDWLRVGEVHDGLRPLAHYPANVIVSVRHADATHWDCYSVPGTRGLFSERFIQAAGNDGFRGMSLLPAKLNEATYFFLRCDQRVDCFDLENSEFDTYPDEPEQIMDIPHYAFREDCLPKDCFFCIPEDQNLLLTESMAIRLNAAGLKGIRLLPLP